ncbi:protein CPR-5-like [Oryza brachyantha]|uniref:protein CPR-5-like n=1 Tax=Oryza brachyantha TaxID=4533 RepID=UPI001ADCBD48|nr:protein CPR-5-like [Oryza brachyantha]
MDAAAAASSSSSSSTSAAAVAVAPAGASSSGSPAASSSRNPHRQRKGFRLRMLRRRRGREPPEPERAAGDRGGAVQEDLALPLGMSFAAVLAQVINTKNISGQTLHPDFLSKICTSAVKESLTNIYGDSSNSFMRNFEKSFSSTFRTLHLVNEIPVNEKSHIPECSYKHDDSVAVDSLSSSDSQNLTNEIEQDLVNTVQSQLVLFASDNQQLTHLRRSRSSPESHKRLINAIEKSANEQAHSNELKKIEIGLTIRNLQLKQSKLALSSYSHMLEKIKLSFGFQKASFQGEKFKTQMQETRDAQILRTLIDFLVSAVIVMSVCFGYGTYVYSYQRITDITSACSATSKGPKSWWMPNSVSNFSSGFLFIRCHVIAVTRLCFGILMILAISRLALQRSATTGSSMPITFNLILLGIICGFAGRFCTNTLGGDGNTWLMYWEVLCSIHLLGNLFPSLIYQVLHGPISVSHREQEVVWLPYWVRRCLFYGAVGLIIPALTGLLPFASLSDWKDHFVEEIKSFVIGDEIEA